MASEAQILAKSAIRHTIYEIRNYSVPMCLWTFAPSKSTPILTTFMQNKANLQDTQMNVSIFSKIAYENKSNWTLGENKPNSNPIKPNLRKAKMNVNSLITKDYRKKDDFAVRKNKPNSNPISVKPKMNASIAIIKDYDNKQRTINNERYSKQTQTKPIYILPQRTLSTLVLATRHGGACRSRERFAVENILLFMANPILA